MQAFKTLLWNIPRKVIQRAFYTRKRIKKEHVGSNEQGSLREGSRVPGTWWNIYMYCVCIYIYMYMYTHTQIWNYIWVRYSKKCNYHISSILRDIIFSHFNIPIIRICLNPQWSQCNCVASYKYSHCLFNEMWSLLKESDKSSKWLPLGSGKWQREVVALRDCYFNNDQELFDSLNYVYFI